MNTARVLIVEDEAVTSLALLDTLDSLGYEALKPVMSGEDAVLSASSERPDLVLMDIKLKGSMDGIEAAGKIWAESNIPIVFLTAYADEETLSRAKLTNPFGYLLKPFKDLDLHATIQIALSNFALHQPVNVSTESARYESSEELIDDGQFDSVTIGNKDVSTLKFLKRIDPLRHLEDRPLSELASLSRFETFKNNQFLAREGDSKLSCFIVASGRVAFLKTAPSGKELTVALLPPGDIFSLAIALGESPNPYSVLAHGDTTVINLPLDTLRSTLSEAPELYKEFHREMSNRIQRSHAFSLRLAHESAEIRVAAALMELASDFGVSKIDDQTKLITVTRQQLAQIAGTTPETAIRVTRAMEDDEILDLKRPGEIRILRFEELERLAGDLEEIGSPV